MSEPKLCPMSFGIPPTESRFADGIYNCLKEKCAWWVEWADLGRGKAIPSHCAIADLPYLANIGRKP